MPARKAKSTARLAISSLAEVLDFGNEVAVTEVEIDGDHVVLTVTGPLPLGELLTGYTVDQFGRRRFDGFSVAAGLVRTAQPDDVPTIGA